MRLLFYHLTHGQSKTMYSVRGISVTLGDIYICMCYCAGLQYMYFLLLIGWRNQFFQQRDTKTLAVCNV